MTEAICTCRHCNWGQKRGDAGDVLEMATKHLQTGHDVDIRLYNPDVDCPIELGKDSNKLTHLERTGEFK